MSPPAISLEDYIATYLTECGPSDDPKCPICTCDWYELNTTIVKTHCGHTFHKECVVTWLSRSGCGCGISSTNSCPTCRSTCFNAVRSSDCMIEYNTRRQNMIEYNTWRLNMSRDLDINEYREPWMRQWASRAYRRIVSADVIRQRFGVDLANSMNPNRFRDAYLAIFHEITTPPINPSPDDLYGVFFPDKESNVEAYRELLGFIGGVSAQGVRTFTECLYSATTLVYLWNRNEALQTPDQFAALAGEWVINMRRLFDPGHSETHVYVTICKSMKSYLKEIMRDIQLKYISIHDFSMGSDHPCLSLPRPLRFKGTLYEGRRSDPEFRRRFYELSNNTDPLTTDYTVYYGGIGICLVHDYRPDQANRFAFLISLEDLDWSSPLPIISNLEISSDLTEFRLTYDCGSELRIEWEFCDTLPTVPDERPDERIDALQVE